MNELDVLDIGPGFNANGGVQSKLPPAHGEGYRVLVQAPGPDGVAKAGIQTMMTRVPLGTNTGWNVRSALRAPDLCGLDGGFLPFARDAAERNANGDPRRSLQERYNDKSGFLDAVRKAADELVSERFMLRQDADKFLGGAASGQVLP